MLNKFLHTIIALSFLLAATSCNSDNNSEPISAMTYSNVAMTGFSLEKNDSLVANLDSVYFAIDLDNAMVYNPDSLPKGTRLNRIVIKPSYADVSKAELIMRLDSGNDTTVNYTTSYTDSINFENGPVYLELTAADGFTKRRYEIKINVHKMDPAMFAWTEFGLFDFGGLNPGDVEASGAAVRGDSLRVLFSLGASRPARLFTGSGNRLDKWEERSVSLPSGADVGSFTASANAFYLIASGHLYKAGEITGALSDWTDTGVGMDYIYGVQAELVVGNRRNGTSYFHASYPASAIDGTPIPADCPVKGTSQMITYTTPWAVDPMSMFTGGELADATLSGSTWAFDGAQWQPISANGVPPRRSMAVVPYFAFSVNNQWIVDERSIMLGFGGEAADGSFPAEPAVSYDRGIHWTPAAGFITFPEQMLPLKAPRAFTINSISHEGETPAPGLWIPVEPNAISPLVDIVASTSPESRAVRPITEWDTPYIYILDGNSARLWRGVMQRLTYKPLQ